MEEITKAEIEEIDEEIRKNINKEGNKETNNKSGKKRTFFVVLVIAVIILITVFLVLMKTQPWSKEITEPKETGENETGAAAEIEEEQNETEQETENAENQTEENETQQEQEEQIGVPNPSGEINVMDIRNDAGGYYCDNVTAPEHKIRLYTYRSIEGQRVLSDDYIESEKIDDVCDYYQNISAGIKYNLEWRWTSVEGIDGYKIYQYYYSENITREYDYSVSLNNIATKLVDTGLKLWRYEQIINSSS